MDIIDIMRRAAKAGMNRLGNEFSPVTDAERQANMARESNMMRDPNIASLFQGQQMAPRRFPSQDDMMHHRGSAYTVPGDTRRQIMRDYDMGVDYGYESGRLPADVIDKVLIEEEMRRRNRAMPGSPVDY